MPRCWAHSPTLKMSGSLVTRVSSTRIARSQAMPNSWASSLFGRMPAEMTTMSQSISVPSLKRTPVTSRSPRNSCVLAEVSALMPSFSIVSRKTLPPASSSCTPMSHGPISTTVTSKLCVISPLAASRPSSPPPMTTAFFLPLAKAAMLLQSSMVRNRNTPCRVVPGIGGTNGRDPVAKTSWS